jgi:hypothetical protein
MNVLQCNKQQTNPLTNESGLRIVDERMKRSCIPTRIGQITFKKEFYFFKKSKKQSLKDIKLEI